jgi:hypothetical protein
LGVLHDLLGARGELQRRPGLHLLRRRHRRDDGRPGENVDEFKMFAPKTIWIKIRQFDSESRHFKRPDLFKFQEKNSFLQKNKIVAMH